MRPFISTVVLVLLILATPACAPAQSAGEEGLEEAVAGAQRDAEAAANEKQRQAQEALKQADAAQKQAEDAALQAQQLQQESLAYGRSVAASTPAIQSLSLNLLQHAAQSILVIPAEEIKPEDLAAITEDIGIMCRVLEKNLEQEARIEPAKRMLFPFGGNNETEGIYLEGYGVLLLLNVNFPLIPPPETKKEEPQKEEGDPVWQETKRELYSTREGMDRAEFGTIYALRDLELSSEKYDPEKIEQLKTTLIKSLKHAANIRNLKPEDSVIITIRGCAPAGIVEVVGETLSSSEAPQTSKSRVSITSANRRRAELVHDNLLTVVSKGEVSGGSTIMTIRAKKADIDIFAKGKATLDQFRQKVRINTYSTGGPGTVIHTVQPRSEAGKIESSKAR